MMNKDEAVQKLATAGRLSIAHAEDLYDSFFPKPVVPQFVADWYEVHKNNFESDLYYLIRYWEEKRTSDFCKWFDNPKNEAIKTFVNMHQFGYEVEKEPRYTVKFKGIDDGFAFLNYGTHFDEWAFSDDEGTKTVRVAHTRKELEDADFGWVFDCPGVEVKEVE